MKRLSFKCENCGKIGERVPSAKRRYCSQPCAYAHRVKLASASKVCEACGESFTVRRSQKTRKCCGFLCAQKLNARKAGRKRSAWSSRRGKQPGGEYSPNTYIKLNGRHYHRIVAEKKLGRPLRPGEIVHHIDGNRRNNDPDNLAIITQSQHARIHGTKNRKCSIPGCERKHSARGYCELHWRRIKKGIPPSRYRKL